MNEQIPEKKRKVFALLLDSLLALRRENKEVIYSSMLKDTIKRKKPSFNEEYYGYRTFSELLEDAQREGLLEIEKHKSSGMYVVTRFGLEMKPRVGRGARCAAATDGRRAAARRRSRPDRRDAAAAAAAPNGSRCGRCSRPRSRPSPLPPAPAGGRRSRRARTERPLGRATGRGHR